MEYIVYKVTAEYETEVLGDDGIFQKRFEKCFEDLFSSKCKAIAKAQKLFSKRTADYVVVRKVLITERGAKAKGRVYTKFRQT